MIQELLEENEEWKLKGLLKIASLSRSTYYFEIKKSDFDDKNIEIIEEI